MSALKELLAQKVAIEQKIAEARHKEVSAAVEQARNLVSEFGLTAEDIFPSSGKKARKASGKVAAKYRDPLSGATWTGRGKPPRWIANQDRASFEIA